MNRKKILSLIILTISSLIFLSCNKELNNVQVTPGFITVKQSGGVYDVDVRANCAWSSSIKYKDDISGYVSPNECSGKGNEKIHLTIAPNTSASTRNCTIEFYPQGATSPQSSVSIIQEGLQ